MLNQRACDTAIGCGESVLDHGINTPLKLHMRNPFLKTNIDNLSEFFDKVLRRDRDSFQGQWRGLHETVGLLEFRL